MRPIDDRATLALNSGQNHLPDLPSIIPLFPLPSVVLFPGVELPLRIFEPRYRQMIADIADNHGTIGMMLLKEGWQRDYEGTPDIFEIGCAGVIDKLVPLPDGRYNLILRGVSEFRVAREIRTRSYRQAQTIWCPVQQSALELDSEAMETLHELLIGFLGEPAHEAWAGIVEQRGLRDAALVNLLCFHLDLAPIEKQTLLEALGCRVGSLFDLLAFKIEEQRQGGGSKGGSDPIQ